MMKSVISIWTIALAGRDKVIVQPKSDRTECNQNITDKRICLASLFFDLGCLNNIRFCFPLINSNTVNKYRVARIRYRFLKKNKLLFILYRNIVIIQEMKI